MNPFPYTYYGVHWLDGHDSIECFDSNYDYYKWYFDNAQLIRGEIECLS